MLPNLEYLADKNIRMAKSYYEQGKYPEALKHYEEAYKKQEKALETAHMAGERGDVQKKALADILVSKGVMHLEMAEYEDANKDFTEAEGIYGQLSAGEGDYAVIYHNRGLVSDKRGDYNKALEWHQKALTIVEKVLGKEHPDTATAYSNIAGVFYAQCQYKEALEWHRKALAIWEKVLGKEHPDTAAAYNNIALVYDAQGKHEEALEWLRKAYRIFIKALGEPHPYTRQTRRDMETVYQKTRNAKPFSEWLAGPCSSRAARHVRAGVLLSFRDFARNDEG